MPKDVLTYRLRKYHYLVGHPAWTQHRESCPALQPLLAGTAESLRPEGIQPGVTLLARYAHIPIWTREINSTQSAPNAGESCPQSAILAKSGERSCWTRTVDSTSWPDRCGQSKELLWISVSENAFYLMKLYHRIRRVSSEETRVLNKTVAYVAVGRISQERHLFGVPVPTSDLSWSRSGVPSLNQHISTGFFHTLLLSVLRKSAVVRSFLEME